MQQSKVQNYSLNLSDPFLNQNSFHIKKLSELDSPIIDKLIKTSLMTGTGRKLFRNLKNEKITNPQKLWVSYILNNENIASWMLIDKAGEYWQSFPPCTSLMFYTRRQYRKKGHSYYHIHMNYDLIKNDEDLFVYCKDEFHTKICEKFKLDFIKQYPIWYPLK